MHRSSWILLLVPAACVGSTRSLTHAFKMPESPPIAEQRPHATKLHGEDLTDNYHWLRSKDNPAVSTYLEAENAWANRLLAPTQDLKERIFEEIKGRIQETDISVPYRVRDWLYYSRTQTGQQYPTYYRKRAVGDPEEQAYLDVNTLAEGQAFLGIGTMSISPDSKLLAYSTDTTGFRQYTLHFLNLTSGEHFPERIPLVSSVAWCLDSQTIFYTTEDDSKRSYRLHRHSLGSTPDTDPVIYQEDDERFRVSTWRTLSDRFIFLDIESHTTSDLRFIPADQPSAEFQAIAPRQQAHEYSVSHRGDAFLIRTNDKGSNFRLVTTPTAKPEPANWVETIPHRAEVMLASAQAFEKFTVITERDKGLVRLRFLQADQEDHYLELPEDVYELGSGANRSFDLDQYRYRYESMVTPPSTLDYHPETRASSLLKETPVLGDYDKTRYRTTRIYATATDGTQVPISLVHDQSVALDGSAPIFLTGYGSYGYSYPTHFSHARLSLLERGMIYAIAHIRGGGEMGKPWHETGRMSHKMNSFTDFIACTEHLITARYGSPSRIVVQGGSAGGLLMGAVANLRPELFRLVILDVPFVDVINTMLDETLPLTVGEFEEWGNPKNPEQYSDIRSYCPYSNLAKHAYPAMLVRTSFNDSQVMYWEPAKYVAKLRTVKTNNTPLLFKTNMAGGHGGSSGRYDAWKETAEDYAYALWMIGIKQ